MVKYIIILVGILGGSFTLAHAENVESSFSVSSRCLQKNDVRPESVAEPARGGDRLCHRQSQHFTEIQTAVGERC